MEDLIGAVVVIIGAIAAIVNAINRRKQAPTKFPPAAQVRQQTAPAAPASMVTMLPQVQPAVRPTVVPAATAGIAPTVHTHLAPDCDVHDASGSLNYISSEGKDPCHEAQLSIRTPLTQEEAPAPALRLEWTGEALVNAFVMQEILTRPAQRRAR